MSDQQSNITPPADAPLPWRTDESWPHWVMDATGQLVVAFESKEHAAYAVAAANALPGLVGAMRKTESALADTICHIRDRDPAKPGYILALKEARAALAALPKEVRGA